LLLNAQYLFGHAPFFVPKNVQSSYHVAQGTKMGLAQLSVSAPVKQISHSAANGSSFSAVQAFCACCQWRQICKVQALQIIGLAIAVFLWGYNYKLSLYCRHPTPASLNSVAKVWLSLRNTSEVKAESTTSTIYSDFHFHGFTTSGPQLPYFEKFHTVFYFPYSRRFLPIDLPVPARSPPVKSFI